MIARDRVIEQKRNLPRMNADSELFIFALRFAVLRASPPPRHAKTAPVGGPGLRAARKGLFLRLYGTAKAVP